MLDLIIKNGQCYIDGELKDVDVAVKDGKVFYYANRFINSISDKVNSTSPSVSAAFLDLFGAAIPPRGDEHWSNVQRALPRGLAVP